MDSAICIDNFNFTTKVRPQLRRLTLVNFRNYKYLRLNFEKPFIVLYGENGSGKTNILEAISFLSQGKGLRGAKLSEIKTYDFLAERQPSPVFINNNGWAVSGTIQQAGEEYQIGTAVESLVKELDYQKTKEIERRIVQVNNQKLTSQSELGNYLSLVWVTPQMDRLFQSSSQNRRNFIDRIVCSFDNNHSKRLSSFDNVYRQWLQILKSGNINNRWLVSLEEQIACIGVAIACARKEQIEQLNNFMEKNPDDIFPEATLMLDGTIEKLLDEKPAIYVEDFYRESLLNQRRSILYNNESFGINKTDVKAIYKKKNIPANLCSTGEQKSMLLSIILAQARSLINYNNIPPIMLLDEIAAHLDETKKDALLSKLQSLNTQVFLTTTNMFEFTSIKDYSHFFEVSNNTVKETFI